ncbi:unnamed protein product [Chrysoparadoxa australica]
MIWIDTVASYLPSLIVDHLMKHGCSDVLPSRQEYETVCIFRDVSGFTALSEAMMNSDQQPFEVKGPMSVSDHHTGVEGLAKHLNSYFGQMVRIIASEGGDVFKFAGDAMIVLWPPPARDHIHDRKHMTREESETPMERRVRRAVQCAFAIQEELHDCQLAEGVRLSVKIGIGMGKVSVLHLGGVHKRMEYIAVGEPLLQAFTAEHHATSGQVIVSEAAFKLVRGRFVVEETFSDSYVRVDKEGRYTPLRKQNKHNMLPQISETDPLLVEKVKGYIPGAVLRNLRPDSPEDEHWSNEIRRISVLFVNLGLKDQHLLAAASYDEAMNEVHSVMVSVQQSIYEYEGSINKFLMDDKGSTLVAVFGLPPVAHSDDPIRAVLSALRLSERLFDLALMSSVGITTGEAFCGVVGSKTRKEYTVLGDTVNLSARLMQRAFAEDGGVLCDLTTKRACGGLLQFRPRGDFRIKGKKASVKVFQPYPSDFPKPLPPHYLGANIYSLIHTQQKQNYAMHKLLTSLQAYFSRPHSKPGSNSPAVSAPTTPTGDRKRRNDKLSGETDTFGALGYLSSDSDEGSKTESRTGERRNYRAIAQASPDDPSEFTPRGAMPQPFDATPYVQPSSPVTQRTSITSSGTLGGSTTRSNSITQPRSPPQAGIVRPDSMQTTRRELGVMGVASPDRSPLRRSLQNGVPFARPPMPTRNSTPLVQKDLLVNHSDESQLASPLGNSNRGAALRKAFLRPGPEQGGETASSSGLAGSSRFLGGNPLFTGHTRSWIGSRNTSPEEGEAPEPDGGEFKEGLHDIRVMSPASSPIPEAMTPSKVPRSAPPHFASPSVYSPSRQGIEAAPVNSPPPVSPYSRRPLSQRPVSQARPESSGSLGSAYSYSDPRRSVVMGRQSVRPSMTQNGLVPLRRSSSPSLLKVSSNATLKHLIASQSKVPVVHRVSSMPPTTSLPAMTAAGVNTSSPLGVGAVSFARMSSNDSRQTPLIPHPVQVARHTPGASIFDYKVGDDCDDFKCVIALPGDGNWKLADLTDESPRLPVVRFGQITTFCGLLEHCWELARDHGHLEFDQGSSPDDFVLNIMGTRAFLPKEDYDIMWLPAFVSEARISGYRRSLQYMDRKRIYGREEDAFGDVVELVLTRQNAILNVQSRWLNCRLRLLEHKIALINRHEGCVIILEGGPGSGKTALMSLFAAHTLPHSALIHFTAASPYHNQHPFGAWAMVMQQFLDTHSKDKVVTEFYERMNIFCSTNPSTRQTLSDFKMRDYALLAELEDDQELLEHAHLVNEIVGTQIPKKFSLLMDSGYSSSNASSDSEGEADAGELESEAVSGVPDDANAVKRQRQRRILYKLVRAMARVRPRVVVMDDAQYMDKDSWSLALEMATGGSTGVQAPIMMIFALRPLAHYRGMFASMPPDYRELCEVDSLVFLKLDGLPPEEVEDLVSEKLGANVVSISDSLFALVEEQCMGNPLIITELISHLKMMEPPKLRYVEIRSEGGGSGKPQNNIGVDMHVSLIDNFKLGDVSVPDKIAAFLTAQTDRLDSCQLMILKTGSVIGKQFSSRFLHRVYPIEGHRDKLVYQLEELTRLGFLVEVATTAETTEPEDRIANQQLYPTVGEESMTKGIGKDKVYKFMHGFMREMLQGTMLGGQKAQLREVIGKLNSKLETQRRIEMCAKIKIDHSVQLKEGRLMVQKRKAALSEGLRQKALKSIYKSRRSKVRAIGEKVDWKLRYCRLTGACLSMYSGATNPTECTQQAAQQVIYLEGARVDMESMRNFLGANVFRVDCNKWVKGGVLFEGRDRAFFFAAESNEAAESWVYMIRYGIEAIEVQQRSVAPKVLDKLGIRRQEEKNLLPDMYEQDLQSTGSMLVVKVECGEDIMVKDIYGSTYPFCVLELDDQKRQTRCIQNLSLEPAWGEEVRFPISMQQWLRSGLRVSVWNHDLFLTDDFLGRAVYPLKALQVHEWTGSAKDDEENAELIWLDLLPKMPGEKAVGRVLLSMRLYLRSDLNKSGQPEGLDALKDEASARLKLSSLAAAVGKKHHVHSSSLGLAGAQIQLGRKPSEQAITLIRQSILEVEAQKYMAVESPKETEALDDEKNVLKAKRRISFSESLTSEEDAERSTSGVVKPRKPRSRSLGSGTSVRINGAPPSNPLARQLQLDLLAVEVKADSVAPRPGFAAVDREWVKKGLRRLVNMTIEGQDCDEDFESNEETFFCKDTKGNIYGPFPRRQLVQAHNDGCLNDRKVAVKPATAASSSDEVFTTLSAATLQSANRRKSLQRKAQLNSWIVTSEHPIFDKIHNSSDLSKDITKWEFHVLPLEAEELDLAAMGLMALTPLPQLFKVPIRAFMSFMRAVAFYMERNFGTYYHNMHHAVDVMQATWFFLFGEGMHGCNLFGKLNQFALMLSAVCHDLDHPGVNNAFLVNSQDKLAITYNDRSVLENHHVSVAWKILRQDQCNILVGLTAAEKKSLRAAMVDGILHTDMEKHGAMIKNLKEMTSRVELFEARAKGHDGFDGSKLTAVDTQLCFNAVLHSADVSASGRVWATCFLWVEKLMKEFESQAMQEREMGLPIAVIQGPMATTQPGFIDMVLVPLFTALVPLVPGVSHSWLTTVMENRARWVDMCTEKETE